MLSNKNHNSSLKSLSSSCSWCKGWVKRPGRCRVCHLRGERNERPNTEPDSHPKRLWPQQPTTPSYILGHQHQTSFSQKVLTTEDLINLIPRFGIPLKMALKSLLPSPLSTRDAFNWVLSQPSSDLSQLCLHVFWNQTPSCCIVLSWPCSWALPPLNRDSKKLPANQTKQPTVYC